MPKTKPIKRRNKRKNSLTSASNSSSSSTSSLCSTCSGSSSDSSLRNERLRRKVKTLKRKLRSKSSAYYGKIDSVPTFSGGFQETNVKQWINNIDTTGDMFEWDEKARVYCMVNKLKGNARTWYLNQDNTKLSWEEWKKKLKNAFPPQQCVFGKLRELVNVQREPSQNLVDFYYQKVALGQYCKLEDKVIVDVIANTINDPFLKSGIRAAACVSTKHLLQFLIVNADRTRHIQHDRDIKIKYAISKT
uniref:Retrotransposon gag domain-containing protein n=1 Tax=Anoplophora glabripennis TaxID=217634 RepID=V5GJH5_ANOGL